ncbi:HD domain-containing protein [bacterium]|nr:HD domain-containing protein [bacterium]
MLETSFAVWPGLSSGVYIRLQATHQTENRSSGETESAVNHIISPSVIESLQATLSDKRFQHSQNVLATAMKIAEAWDEYSIDRTCLSWAALFHDCGKELNIAEQTRLLNQGELPYGNELIEQPKLTHAPLGAKILYTRYGIDSPDVLMAVAYHPTGHPGLNPIGWIVYAADYLEPGRVYFEQREAVLQTVCESPIQGLQDVTELKIQAVLQKGKNVHPITSKVKHYLEKTDRL